jgi:di/tricarboxylate transporter
MFLITQWWVRYYFRTAGVGVPGGAEKIKAMQSDLPPMKGQDWFILGVFSIVALLWMTESWHKIPSAVAILIGIILMFAPGFVSFKWKAIEDRTIWGTWIMLGGALSISGVMTSSGLANWLAAFIHPMVQGHPWWAMLLLVLVGTHVIRLGILSNIAAITVFAPILVALAPKLGLHPAAFVMLVANCDTFAYLLPTQLTAAVIAYSTGTFTMTDYFRVGWLSVAIAILYTLVIMVPWYAFLGIPLWNPAAPWPF